MPAQIGLLLIVFLSGCVTMNPDAALRDVSAAVEERGALKVSWIDGTELDMKAANKIQALLKEKLSADVALQIGLLNNRDLQAM